MSASVRRRASQAGLLLALFALALRLALPGTPWPAPATSPTAELARLLGSEMPICHSGAGLAPSTPEPGGKPAPHAHDCALCPVCQLAAAPVLPPGAAWLHVPSLAQAVAPFMLPPSTVPLLPARDAHPPRGPPASA